MHLSGTTGAGRAPGLSTYGDRRTGAEARFAFAWYNPLFIGGYSFDTPPPAVTSRGIEPYPEVCHRRLDARFSFFFFATGITPASACASPALGRST